MTAFKSDFLKVLQERGFVHQFRISKGSTRWPPRATRPPMSAMIALPPSLHIGNYPTIMMLYWLQQSGNKPITLMGGGTTMVGDPSGKDESRALRSVEEIEANKTSIRGVFSEGAALWRGPQRCGHGSTMPNG